MSRPPQRESHHFVPRMYLKHFAGADGRLLTYRTLVSDPRVPLWKSSSLRGVALHAHLYTRIVTGEETDEVERWFDREFEAPAEDALQRAVSVPGARLSPGDWSRLIRFAAAQDVRTPARLLEQLQRWQSTLPGIIESTLRRSVQQLEEAREAGELPESPPPTPSEGLPFRITAIEKAGQDGGELKAETIAGRGLWLWAIQHLLTKTAKVLHQHRWTILIAPPGLEWFTTDDPVIKLNFYGEGQYDFKGGWGNNGTEILLPLSPRHLMYTKVGGRRPQRGTVVEEGHAEMLRRFIAEHAHRMIFAASPDPAIPALRPRLADAERFRSEREQWRTWHREQSDAERRLMGYDEDP